jgi:hypothetical protein
VEQHHLLQSNPSITYCEQISTLCQNVPKNIKYIIYKYVKIQHHIILFRKLFHHSQANLNCISNFTEIIWYEFDIIAISILRSTITFITEYEPNISSAQKRVKLLTPVNSKAIKSTMPKLAQNKDWDVSNKLKQNI